MNNPLVSIAVLTYNHEKFIQQAIDSFLTQKTNFDFEIIIGDDASLDHTQDILSKYQKEHPSKFKITYHSENIGMIPNFIQTIENCSGKYIAFCEGDDYWLDETKLQKQVDFLEKNEEFSICFHEAKIFDEESQVLKDDFITINDKSIYDISDLVKGNFMHTPSVMIRNNFTLPKWFYDLPIGDWPLYLFQVKDKKIKKLDNAMAAYRIHNQSAWSSKKSLYKISRTITVMDIISKHIPLSNQDKSILENQMNIYIKDKNRLEKSFYRRLKNFFRKRS